MRSVVALAFTLRSGDQVLGTREEEERKKNGSQPREINSWNLSFSVEISKPRILKSKRRRLIKKARRSQRVLEDNGEAGLMKGVPPLLARLSFAQPPATDHQAVINGADFKGKTLLVADLVMDKQVPEKKRIASVSSDLVTGCSYDFEARGR